MRNQLLAAATSVTIVTLALPAAAGFPAGHRRTPTLLEHAAAPGQEPAPIVPPVPQPARRPHKSPAADPPDTLLSTVWAQWWEFRLGERIPAQAFRPVPRVDGGTVVVTRRARPLLPAAVARDYAAFVRARWPFAQRE